MRIFAGAEAWRHAKSGQRLALVVPLDSDPHSLDWSFLHDHDAVVVQTGACPLEHLQKIGDALIRAGVSPVVVLVGSEYRAVVFRGG